MERSDPECEAREAVVGLVGLNEVKRSEATLARPKA